MAKNFGIWFLVLLILSACRPFSGLKWAEPGSTAEPATIVPASPTAAPAPTPQGEPPGPVLALDALPGGDYVAGVGPVGSAETGFEWQLWRGSGDEWRRLNWPTEASPLSLHASPVDGEIFAVPFSQAIYGRGQAWGLMRSADGGKSWHQIISGIPDPYVMGLVLSPAYAADHNLYAVTWHSGIFRSVDSGGNWQSLPNPGDIDPSGGASPYDLTVALSPGYAFSPQDGIVTSGEVLASFGRGLRRWEPGANAWQTTAMTVTTPLEDFDPKEAILTAHAIAFSPDFTRDETVYLYSGFAGMFRSLDAGNTWTSIQHQLPDPRPLEVRAALAAASPTEVFALLPKVVPVQDGNTGETELAYLLYRTVDGGLTWQALREPPTLGYVSAFCLTASADGGAVLVLGGSLGGVTTHRPDDLRWD